MTGKILVVDDEDTLRLTLKARLAASSFEVDTARDGEEALQKLKESPFDIVLLDIAMPKMDGIMTLDHIMADHPSSDVIMLTGFADFTTAIDCLKKGAKDYLVKPIDATELITRLKSLMRARSSEQALETMKKENATLFTDDLLSPLTYSNVLLERVVKGDFGKVTNAQTTYLNYHRELSDRMIDTLRSRLDAGQLRALRMENPGEKFDLGRIVNELMKRSSLFAKARQVKLASDIPSGLPKVLGDPRKLSLAFESVFLVAIEASPKGSTIAVAVTKDVLDKKMLRVSVSCKVPARHVQRMVDIIGQPIEQFEDAFKDMKIEDLRLLLSRWTIELHGGVASQELGKKGTISMIFDLPIAPSA